MRIALFTDSDAFAGTERHMQDLSLGLGQQGLDVRVCCPSASPLAQRVTAGGGSVMPVERGRGLDWPAVRLLASALRSGQIDLIHAHNGRTALIATLARRWATRGQVVMTQHFISPAYASRHGVRGAISRAVHHWVDGQLDHVIAISHAVCDEALRRGEVGPGEITVVHNGICPPDAPPNAMAVRESLGLPAGSLVMLCAARLVREKRIDVLVEAMRTIAASAVQVICLIAGDGDARSELQRQIDQSHLADRVRLLGFREDVAQLMAACDLFVLPSDAEPFGLAVVEAMALGRCTIATAAGGPKEIIEHGVSGLLVPPGDPAALATAVLGVSADAAARERLGEAAKDRVQNHFHFARMAAGVKAVYERVFAAAARRATSAEASSLSAASA